MTEQEKQNWLRIESINLFVSKQYHHHHSFEIINAYSELRDKFLNSLSNQIKISPRIKRTRTSESKGIKADDLNKVIRELLNSIPNNELKFEVYEENGVFYFSEEKSSIGGFDFAILNHYNNILALRNLCFGNLQYADGESRWSKFLKKNPDLVQIANDLKRINKKGVNIERINQENTTPLIVGEIQFGNWALAYRDFFKVLKADVQNSVDCLVYIVPTGSLEKLLSDGIVTFDKTKKIIEEFSKVISVPVWLIGIDVSIED
ncbi:MAG: hypothetical protein K0B10_02950 [Vicingaceae bacterium]|nr:hypothetical protein [Vicingaceae bacterium]